MIDRTKISEPWKCADPISYRLLKENADHNKKYPTEAENYLWRFLHSKALGVRFRQQYIIDNYIADFVCLSKNLIIEIDGGYHNDPAQQKEDSIRTFRLQELGFKEIRFTNEEVLSDIDNVLTKIEHELNK